MLVSSLARSQLLSVLSIDWHLETDVTVTEFIQIKFDQIELIQHHVPERHMWRGS